MLLIKSVCVFIWYRRRFSVLMGLFNWYIKLTLGQVDLQKRYIRQLLLSICSSKRYSFVLLLGRICLFKGDKKLLLSQVDNVGLFIWYIKLLLYLVAMFKMYIRILPGSGGQSKEYMRLLKVLNVLQVCQSKVFKDVYLDLVGYN